MRTAGYCVTIGLAAAMANRSESDIRNSVISELTGNSDFDAIRVYFERGEGGHPHYQVAVRFKARKRLPTVKKWVKSIFGIDGHIEPMKGTDKQAFDYCEKDGDCVFTAGEPKVSHSGARNDLDAIYSRLGAGESVADLVADGTARSYQQIKAAEKLAGYVKYKRKKPFVVWIFGKSGAGKSYLARDMMGGRDVYQKESGRWWDGVGTRDDIIFDDYRGSWMTKTKMLKVLDEYSGRVETKGGHATINPEVIIITSIHHPKAIYQDTVAEGLKEPSAQWLRRIHYTVEVGKQSVFRTYKVKKLTDFVPSAGGKRFTITSDPALGPELFEVDELDDGAGASSMELV